MILTDLKIHSLRNIIKAHLQLNSRFNFIYGANGSGKTSILEALYLLSCGHSFRSREIAPIINQDQDTLTIFARAENEESISIQKSRSEPTQVKLNNQFCYSTSQLAYAMPCQIFYSDIFQIIDAGASIRRSVLDWGLFHVKHNYLAVWKEYKKVLKQRNALLKTRVAYNQFIPWDLQLSHLANELDVMRKEYFAQWASNFIQVLSELTDVSCTIGYYRGWDKKESGKPLKDLLAESFESDMYKSFTQSGAHQADILIESNDFKAKQVLSRGQQKIILLGLKLAQAQMVEKDCLYLIDDLAAELDENHQSRLMNYLVTRKGQYVITNTASSQLFQSVPSNEASIFQINSGLIVSS